MKWIYSSLVAFVISLAIAVIFIFRGLHILGADKAILYFIILVPLGIACSLMLFKVMRSYAMLKGSYQNYHLELAGPVVVFFLVIGGGYYFYKHPPNPAAFSLTVRFLDKETRQLLSGKATIVNGEQTLSQPVDGETIVKNAVAGNQLEILPDIPNYNTASIKTTVPNLGAPLEVLLERDVYRVDQSTQLKIRFASAFSIYISVAKDYLTVLNDDIPYLLNDSVPIAIEFNNIAVRYAKAYQSLIALKDSISIISAQQSVQNESALEAAFAQFMKTHKNFLGFSNGIRDRINNLYDTQDEKERQIISKEVKLITNNAQIDLEQLEIDVNKASKSFNK